MHIPKTAFLSRLIPGYPGISHSSEYLGRGYPCIRAGIWQGVLFHVDRGTLDSSPATQAPCQASHIGRFSTYSGPAPHLADCLVASGPRTGTGVHSLAGHAAPCALRGERARQVRRIGILRQFPLETLRIGARPLGARVRARGAVAAVAGKCRAPGPVRPPSRPARTWTPSW